MQANMHMASSILASDAATRGSGVLKRDWFSTLHFYEGSDECTEVVLLIDDGLSQGSTLEMGREYQQLSDEWRRIVSDDGTVTICDGTKEHILRLEDSLSPSLLTGGISAAVSKLDDHSRDCLDKLFSSLSSSVDNVLRSHGRTRQTLIRGFTRKDKRSSMRHAHPSICGELDCDRFMLWNRLRRDKVILL
jgi:hypothetical protein